MTSQEAASYEKIGDHPNIVKCYGLTKTAEGEGLVLEAIQGENAEKVFDNLRERYDKRLISHAEFWGGLQFVLTQTLAALDHVVGKGVAHNDIKPDNIMIDAATGTVKLIDFGSASAIGQQKPGLQLPLGLGSVAPEVWFTETATEQSDVFGVGAAAYRVGEKEKFKYADPGDLLRNPTDILDRVKDFGTEKDAEGNSRSALNQGTDEHPASTQGGNPKAPVRTKNAGRYGAATEYTKFVNQLMHPDPTQRLTPRQALDHEFLKDRFLSDEEAALLLKKMVAPPAESPRDKVQQALDSILQTRHLTPENQAKLVALQKQFLYRIQKPTAHEIDRLINLLDKRAYEMEQVRVPVENEASQTAQAEETIVDQQEMEAEESLVDEQEMENEEFNADQGGEESEESIVYSGREGAEEASNDTTAARSPDFYVINPKEKKEDEFYNNRTAN